MLLTTLGHATLVIRESAHATPLLITDPWVLGSCYWRSWWLERYPTPAQIADIARARHCFLTHEHPDHFHTPSIRRIGRGPTYLVPEFSRERMGRYLRERGFTAETVSAGSWRPLAGDVRILSMPTIGNDSALLVDTPDALIANLNDARPAPDQLLALRRLRRRAGKHKRCILLASYSTAGIGHSMYKRGQRLDFAGNGRHLRYVVMLSRALDAQVYVPFASQVRFERPDTRWANAFRVSFDDVRAHLHGSPLEVLPPYITLDLRTGAFTSEHAQPAHREPGIAERVEAQLASEAQALDDDDIQRLAAKLYAAGRGWLGLLFPRGIGFELPSQRLCYNPFTGRIGPMRGACSLTLRVPAQAVKDVLATGYFSDLCIPMFSHVELAPEVPPHAVYAFFVMMQLHDIGVTTSLSDFGRWASMLLHERLRTLQGSSEPRAAPRSEPGAESLTGQVGSPRAMPTR